jgi:hypothetical protein
MKSGIQKEYHESPGNRYHGADRVAYLPNNPEGRDLLARLKYSFLHGYSFQIGTSLTTGASSCVTWTSIHHITSLSGGSHGFPAPKYLNNCHGSLNAVGVPAATKCHADSGSSNRRTETEKLVYTAPDALHEDIHWADVLEPYLSPFSPPLQPSGTMTTREIYSLPCPGFPLQHTIQVTYYIPAAIQHPYHPTPGGVVPETTRVAYVPASPEGRELLQRLTFAFKHGQIFRMGTSLTTGQESVVWAGVPHKTSLKEGEHGFPDPNYMPTCHSKLDALGVPWRCGKLPINF